MGERTWPGTIIRAVGGANVLLGLFGLVAAVSTVRRVAGRCPPVLDLPYEAEAFYVTTAINLAFVLVLIVGGVLLWRFERRALSICNWLFISEIAYWLGEAAIDLAIGLHGGKTGRAIGDALGAVGGIGNMGTALQLGPIYPATALVLLNISYRKLNPSRR